MKLQGKKLAFFVEQEYHDLEFWYPKMRLEEEGATSVIIGSGSASEYKGKLGIPAIVDIAVQDLVYSEFDGFIFTGGFAPIRLRVIPRVLEILREANKDKKLIASICFGTWVLASADIVKDRKIACHAALVDDLRNAGATVVEEAIGTVVDDNIVSSRYLRNMKEFCKGILSYLKQ